MEKRFLLFKAEMKRFRRNERYDLVSSYRHVVAVVPKDPSEGMTADEIRREIGEFRVKSFFIPSDGMTCYKAGEGNFFRPRV